MGECHLTVKGAAEVMLEKAGLNSEVERELDRIGYFRAPASKGHHLARPGGLVEHSVNVTHWLERLTDAGLVSWQRRESPYLIGMLHDLVKCKCYGLEVADDFLLEDADIVLDIRRGADARGQGSQGACSPDVFQNAVPAEALGHGHQVDGGAAVEEL